MSNIEFFKNIGNYIKTITRYAKKKQFTPIENILKQLTSYIIQFRNYDEKTLIKDRLCHDFCNKITSINIATEMQDLPTLEKSLNMLDCVKDLFESTMCNKELQPNTVSRFSNQYSIEFYQNQWFISEEVSKILITALLLQNLSRISVYLYQKELIVEGVYKNFLEDPFFQDVCDNFHEYDNIKVFFDKDKRLLTIKHLC